MTDESLSLPQPRASAFDVAPVVDKHIIDVLIEDRCPSWASHWTWPMFRPIIYKALGYRHARRTADKMATLDGAGCFDLLVEELDVSLTVRNLEHVPKTGRVVIVANHPTGLADGAAVWDTLRRVRKDVVFFANADAIRVAEGFRDVLIPIEWVADKRSPAKARETLRRAGEAFADEKCIVIFPSGKLARRIGGRLTEQDWFPTALSLARKRKAPIVPLHITAKNSALFYFLARVNAELRDITLFRELLNKQGAPFDLTLGPPVPSGDLEGDIGELTERLRDHVAYTMADDPDASFQL